MVLFATIVWHLSRNGTAMANSVQQNAAVSAMASAIVRSDPILREQLSSLVHDVIAHMQFTMKHGMASEKAALYKALAPSLLSALQTSDATERKGEERKAYDRMLSMMRGETDIHSPLAS